MTLAVLKENEWPASRISSAKVKIKYKFQGLYFDAIRIDVGQASDLKFVDHGIATASSSIVSS
jgi:hypothetical protein